MSEPSRLFDDPDVGRVAPEPVVLEPGERVIRVLPDVSGLDKEFDYLVPARLADQVTLGSLVRIELHGRRVAGWVVAIDIEPAPGVSLRAVSKVSSVGPPADVIDLGRWAADRWSGRLTSVLKTASPPTMVRSLVGVRPAKGLAEIGDQLAADALASPGVAVVKVAPAGDQVRFAAAAAAKGNALVIVPGVDAARRVGSKLSRAGFRVHHHPAGWAGGPSGGVVVGSRSAVWAPTGPLDAVVVLDEHDESLQEERNPTWHARDVAVERARRAGVPCLLVSPAPSLAALAVADRVLSVSRADQRRGWPVVEVVDRRDDEPGRGGLFSARAADLLRSAESGVAILNRKGRAPMLACGSCGELVRTEDGEFLMTEVDGALISPRTGETRPLVCAVCTGTQLKRLRLGVTRAAEELSMLVGRPVTEVSAEKRDEVATSDALILGTEAALHRGVDADAVVFLDFDQELHAPRYRAAEQAMWLLVRAARTIGRRRAEGRLLVQTRSPEHRVLLAAMAADPGRMVAEEQALRSALGFPPAGALAEFSGAGADEFAASIKTDPGVMILGPRPDGRYLLRASDPQQLAAVMASAPRPKERIRVAVDPPRI